MPNPSHLEVVNPVLEGVARAQQRVPGTLRMLDESSVLPIAMHGDAAFPGEGVVAETFNMSILRGYRVGGTLHIIVNNQVGFTTDPLDARSTHYASDLAKGFEVPIVHVNGDDAEACIAIRVARIAYRERFDKDFLIDLVGYRRQGHNEADEPAFTQPMIYAAIKAHPTPREVWGTRLATEGVIEPGRDGAARRRDPVAARGGLCAGEVEGGDRCGSGRRGRLTGGEARQHGGRRRAAHRAQRAHAQLALGFSSAAEARARARASRPALVADGGIDWGHAEALALASLLVERHGGAHQRAGCGARHVLAPAGGAARSRNRRDVHAAAASLRRRGAVRDLQLAAVRRRGAGLRVRLQRRVARMRSCCGRRSTATSRTSRSASSISSSRRTARSGGRTRAS